MRARWCIFIAARDRWWLPLPRCFLILIFAWVCRVEFVSQLSGLIIARGVPFLKSMLRFGIIIIETWYICGILEEKSERIIKSILGGQFSIINVLAKC